MATAKDELRKILDTQPEDSSTVELVRELAVNRPVVGPSASCIGMIKNYYPEPVWLEIQTDYKWLD